MAITETKTEEARIAPIPSTKIDGRQLAVVGGTVLPENMKEVESLGQYMAKAGSAIPFAMQGNPGECMAVIMDAIAWRMNPWAVARMRYITKSKDGHLTGGYMAQLFMAVLNTRAPLKRRMIPEYTGEGPTLVCKVRGETLDGQILEYESPPKAKIKPQNSPLWETDERQQIAFYTFRAFGRRFFPEIFMGVYDPEEVHEIARMRDITPDEPVKNLLDDPDDAPAHVHQGEVIEAERPEKDPRAKVIREAAVSVNPETGHIDIDAEIDQAYDESEQTQFQPKVPPGEEGDGIITRAVEPRDEDHVHAGTGGALFPADQIPEGKIDPDRMFRNLIKGCDECRTAKDYAAWKGDNITPDTRKVLTKEQWAALGKVMAEAEDRVGYL